MSGGSGCVALRGGFDEELADESLFSGLSLGLRALRSFDHFLRCPRAPKRRSAAWRFFQSSCSRGPLILRFGPGRMSGFADLHLFAALGLLPRAKQSRRCSGRC